VVVEWFIREDGHRLDVCGLKMGKQLVQVWDVEPATRKIGALMVEASLLSKARDEGGRADSRFRARMGGIRSSPRHRWDLASRGERERPMNGDRRG
jgi:hypothetical protein